MNSLCRVLITMDDEITECPLETPPQVNAGAVPTSTDAKPSSSRNTAAACSAADSRKATSSEQSRASGAIPKRKAVHHGTVQMFSLSRPNIKDQSQGAQAPNRQHRSVVRPFFCCGSELSLVSLMESVDLNPPGHCSSPRGKAVTHGSKLSLSDSEDSSSDHWLPHSYSCTSNFGAVCGSGASIQTVCGTGKASGGTLVRRVKSDKRKTKKHFWSLRFRKKLPGGVKLAEMPKSVCSECGSKKCYASQGVRCDLMCEKGQACRCQKRSFHCAAAEMARRQGRVADRRASVAGVFPVSGNDELLLGERSLERAGSHPRNRASCNVENFMRHVDEASLSHLNSRLQRLNPGASLAEYASRDPFEEYSPLVEFHSDFVAEDMVDSLIHTRIDFIHHLVPDLRKITGCSFYWGVIDRYEAERLLDKKCEGTFLLRDSAQDDFLFSVSFRRYNRSLHARIEQWNHRFSFDVHDPAVYSSDTVCGLIEHYKDSSRCLFFEPMLTQPLHRTFPFSLQHLARAVICNSLSRYDHISKLPLPMSMKTYLRYYHYKQKVCVRSFEEPSDWTFWEHLEIIVGLVLWSV